MKQKNLRVIFFVFFLCVLFAGGGKGYQEGRAQTRKPSPQSAKPTWSWVSSYEGTMIWGVKETSDGGYIAVGEARSDGSPNKPQGIYLVRLSKAGSKVWEKWWGQADVSSGFDVVECEDGGFVLTGTITPVGEHFDKLVVMKVDSKGALLWQRMIASPLGEGHYLERGYSIQKTRDGGFIVAGFVPRSYKLPGVSGTGPFPYVVKLDSGGNVLWERYYFEQTPPTGALDSNGVYNFQEKEKANTLWDVFVHKLHIVMLQPAKSGGYFLAFTVGYRISGTESSRTLRLLRLDDSGNVVWEKSVKEEDTSTNLGATAMTPTEDDGVVITGYMSPTKLQITRGRVQVGFLMKFDSKGNVVWRRYFLYFLEEPNSVAVEKFSIVEIIPQAIRQTADGGYIVTALKDGYEIIFIKFDREGRVEWDRIFTGGWGFCGAQTSDGGYIMGGFKNLPKGKYKTYGYQAFLFKLDSAGTPPTKYVSGRIKTDEGE